MAKQARIRTPLKCRLRVIRLRLLPIVVWLGAVAVVVMSWHQRVTRLDAPGRIEAQRQAVVAPLQPGTITSLAVSLSDAVRASDVVVIADGPRPPAFVMKGGPIHLARASGVPLYVARASTRPALILPRSWTRMTLPLSRSDVALFSAGPVDTGGSFEDARRRAEAELHRLAEELDAHLYLRRRVHGGVRFAERGL